MFKKHSKGKSLYPIVQSVPSNKTIRSLGLQFIPSSLTSNNSRERIAIQESGLFNSKEWITNPWERIHEIRYNDLLMAYFENLHVPLGLS